MSPSDAPTDLAAQRQRWRDLVRLALPAAAIDHPEWPIRLDHCFARVILDAVCAGPWREAIAAPAWRTMDAGQLAAAFGLAEAVIEGSADVHALDAQSLAWRGKAPKRARRA